MRKALQFHLLNIEIRFQVEASSVPILSSPQMSLLKGEEYGRQALNLAKVLLNYVAVAINTHKDIFYGSSH